MWRWRLYRLSPSHCDLFLVRKAQGEIQRGHAWNQVDFDRFRSKSLRRGEYLNAQRSLCTGGDLNFVKALTVCGRLKRWLLNGDDSKGTGLPSSSVTCPRMTVDCAQ